MEKNEFRKYLKERYDSQVDWYDGRANLNKRLYIFCQWCLIFFSAITPVAIAINQDKVVPIIISSVVAILTTGMKTFKFQENWINYRTTCETLRKEIYYYEASIYDYAVLKDKEAYFVDRVESLISRENTLWLNIHREEHKEEKVKK